MRRAYLKEQGGLIFRRGNLSRGIPSLGPRGSVAGLRFLDTRQAHDLVAPFFPHLVGYRTEQGAAFEVLTSRLAPVSDAWRSFEVESWNLGDPNTRSFCRYPALLDRRGAQVPINAHCGSCSCAARAPQNARAAAKARLH
jgi:hypothetical protein